MFLFRVQIFCHEFIDFTAIANGKTDDQQLILSKNVLSLSCPACYRISDKIMQG